MGYTVTLASTASQNEGSAPDTAGASFIFNLTRQAGDAATDGNNVAFLIRNPTARRRPISR
jgi:hypothetical protein